MGYTHNYWTVNEAIRSAVAPGKRFCAEDLLDVLPRLTLRQFQNALRTLEKKGKVTRTSVEVHIGATYVWGEKPPAETPEPNEGPLVREMDRGDHIQLCASKIAAARRKLRHVQTDVHELQQLCRSKAPHKEIEAVLSECSAGLRSALARMEES